MNTNEEIQKHLAELTHDEVPPLQEQNTVKGVDGKRLVNRIDIQCEDCESNELIMMNNNMIWNTDKQEWVFYDNPNPEYYCPECGMINVDYKEEEIN